jgi:opacity protein-like surface antigen
VASFIFFFCSHCFFQSTSHALFNDPAKSVAGRPRFKRSEKKLMYFGIGVGMNAYDTISCKSCIGFGATINNGLENTQHGFKTDVNFTGFPVLFFGFVPSRAQFLRNNFEVNIKFAPINIDTIKGKYLNIGEQVDYKNVQISTISFRALYELLFGTKPLFGRISFFAGAGFGFAVNSASLSGVVVDSTSTGSGSDSTSTASSSKIKESTNFSITFHGSVGGVFDASQTFGIEVKCRYFLIMTPFGQNTASFEVYRHGFEIIASVLLKI